jgi:hypothetical protein
MSIAWGPTRVPLLSGYLGGLRPHRAPNNADNWSGVPGSAPVADSGLQRQDGSFHIRRSRTTGFKPAKGPDGGRARFLRRPRSIASPPATSTRTLRTI